MCQKEVGARKYSVSLSCEKTWINIFVPPPSLLSGCAEFSACSRRASRDEEESRPRSPTTFVRPPEIHEPLCSAIEWDGMRTGLVSARQTLASEVRKPLFFRHARDLLVTLSRSHTSHSQIRSRLRYRMQRTDVDMRTAGGNVR